MTLEQVIFLMTDHDTINIKDKKHRDLFPFGYITSKQTLNEVLFENPDLATKPVISMDSTSIGTDRKGNTSMTLNVSIDLENPWLLYHFNNACLISDFETLQECLSNGFELKTIGDRIYYRELSVAKNPE